MISLTVRSALLLAALLLAACSGAAAETAPLQASGPAEGGSPPTLLGPDDAVALLADRDDIVVIDVRTPAEFAEGHLDGAALIDVQAASFHDEIDALDREATYVVYCRSGNRSAVAVSAMEQLGFVELYDAGGFADLAAAGAATAS